METVLISSGLMTQPPAMAVQDVFLKTEVACQYII